MSHSSKRREIIKALGTGALGLGALSPAFSFNILSSYPLKANYRLAVIGVNSRGLQHIQALAKIPNVTIAYVCDVDDKALANGIDVAVKSGSVKAPIGIKDFRKALEDPTLDAVSIAMPDHWHTPAALLAMQAGKHVYLEKPGSHNPAEAELLVDATKKYGKVVQMGNQRRSWPRVQEAIQELHSGAIGRVYYARAWYTNTRKSIGRGKLRPTPDWLDFELWQGPAPRMEFRDNLIHYNWHWFWHWGTGEIVNNGVHFLDLARWGLQVDYPKSVYSSGGRYQFEDDWETPDTQIASYQFEDGKTILWEGRSCNARDINGMGSGVSFHGENGTLELLNNSYKIFDNSNTLVKSAEPTSNIVVNQQGAGFDMDVDHFQNFIDAIDNGKSLISPYPEIKKSVLLCHLGNISYRTGKALDINTQTGRIEGDGDAMKLWGREYQPGWEPKL
jgi:predicted dehydrogenase